MAQFDWMPWEVKACYFEGLETRLNLPRGEMRGSESDAWLAKMQPCMYTKLSSFSVDVAKFIFNILYVQILSKTANFMKIRIIAPVSDSKFTSLRHTCIFRNKSHFHTQEVLNKLFLPIK